MKVICAPDSFKESLSAIEAAEAMKRGVLAAVSDAVVDPCPIADGGEGTVQAMLAATCGREEVAQVRGPLGETVAARWGLLGASGRQPLTAVMEMAAASGLALVPDHQRDAALTSTYGTGQLIGAALDAGAERIIMGIGGSATNDGGCGAAQAIGVRFYNRDGILIEEPIVGAMLQQIGRFDLDDLDQRLGKVDLIVACDVNNPLTGPSGASAVYGPQKGASITQVQSLDKGLTHLASIAHRKLGIDVADLPGAGAAGGLGYGAMVFLDAQLRRGVEMVLEAVQFHQRVKACDLCLTGEGKFDGQTLSGKAIEGVAGVAQAAGVPIIALVGAIGPGSQRAHEIGISKIQEIGQGLTHQQSMSQAAELLEAGAGHVVKQFLDSSGCPSG